MMRSFLEKDREVVDVFGGYSEFLRPASPSTNLLSALGRIEVQVNLQMS